MKYKTYRKLRDHAKFLNRIFYIVVAVIVIACLLVIAFTLTHYDATAATKDQKAESVTIEMFTPLDCELSEELQEYTYYICQHYGVEFELAMAIMSVESEFDTAAISETGDYGLMQVNEIHISELSDKLGVTDITDPYQNIRSGVYILGGLEEQYDDRSRAIMAYNIGDYGSSALWEAGVHSTAYVDKVMTKYNEFKEATDGKRQEMR